MQVFAHNEQLVKALVRPARSPRTVASVT
jgi:hypothetical protein